MSEEEIFKGVGREPGIKIWVVNAFKLQAVAPAEYGTFYSGEYHA